MAGKLTKGASARMAAYKGKGPALAAKGKAVARGITGNTPPGLSRYAPVDKVAPRTSGKPSAKVVAETKKAKTLRRANPGPKRTSGKGRM